MNESKYEQTACFNFPNELAINNKLGKKYNYIFLPGTLTSKRSKIEYAVAASESGGRKKRVSEERKSSQCGA